MFKVRKFYNNLKNLFFMPKQHPHVEQVGLIDIYLEHFIDVFLKKESFLSCWIFLGVFHIIAIFIFILKIRPYGILSFIFLCGFIYDFFIRDYLYSNYTGKYGKFINNFKTVLTDIYLKFYDLRKNNAALYHSAMIFLSAIFYYISKSISDIALFSILFTLLLISVSTYRFYIIRTYKGTTAEILNQFFAKNNCDNTLAEDDLIPYIQGKDFSRRTDVDLESLLTDRTIDSVTNSLVSGISSMPSYLELVDPSNDDILEEDLIPSETSREVSLSPDGELSNSDSDELDNNKDVRFDSDHFKNTSSSDEDNFTKDLKIPSASASSSSDNTTLLKNIMQTVEANFVANLLKSNNKTELQTGCSSDGSDNNSDFELIDPEELKKN